VVDRQAFDQKVNQAFINKKHFKNQVYPRPQETFDSPIRQIKTKIVKEKQPIDPLRFFSPKLRQPTRQKTTSPSPKKSEEYLRAL
jgi:hypothetical protein